MCGIAGCVSNDHIRIIDKLVNELIHRGPDDFGLYHDKKNNFSLGMRRLSIQDLKGGHQPMYSQCGDFVIVFNGEIFNSKILRKELENTGYIFKSNNSDTEIIVAGFSLYGKNFINKLNGMFAFLIYQISKSKIYLIRDQIGIKPLYYKLVNREIAISSEINFLKDFVTSSKISNISTAYFLSFGHYQMGKTIYEDIHQVPPGSIIEFDIADGVKILSLESFWDPYEKKSFKVFNKSQLVKEIDKAVLNWCQSDVELSLSLSGGTDSSIILYHLIKNNIIPRCYNINFGDKESCENTNLKKLKAKYSLDITTFDYEDYFLANDFESIITSLGEPYSGSLSSWLIYKIAKGKEKVMLSGTGGDEFFGNYLKWKPYSNIFSRLKFYKNNFHELIQNRKINYINAKKYFPKFFSYELIKELLLDHNSIELAWNYMNTSLSRENISSVPSLYDLRGQLSSEFLSMSDRFSMHNSIELRTPFLDINLINYCLSIPYKQRSGILILRKS